MANNHKTLASLFSDTADAIREKQGSFGSKVADNFPAEIRKIVTVSEGTSDATAAAADIVKDKTAYVKGKKVVGTFVPVTQPGEDLDAEMEEQDNLIAQLFEAIDGKVATENLDAEMNVQDDLIAQIFAAIESKRGD
jgi:hypothetical protein